MSSPQGQSGFFVVRILTLIWFVILSMLTIIA